MDWVWMAIFLLLLVNAFIDRLRHSWMLRRGERSEERGELNIKEGDMVSDITIYDVKEMACNHCKANVEKIISGIAGVESVEVDLVKGIAYVHGQHDHSEVERQVTANGYPTTLKV
jgi:copper chaperone CopZ